MSCCRRTVVLGLSGAVFALLATVSTPAQGEVRTRKLLTGKALRAAYPGRTFIGNVQVEEGVRIARGVTLKAGEQPLYVLGRTRLDAGTTIQQQGSRPLVLLHLETANKFNWQGSGVLAKVKGDTVYGESQGGRISNSAVTKATLLRFSGKISRSDVGLSYLEGPAVLRRTKTAAGVITGNVEVIGSTVSGVVAADRRNPLRLEGETVEPLQARIPRAFRAELTKKSVPRFDGAVEMHGLRVFDAKGTPKADQSFIRYPNSPSFTPSTLGADTNLVVDGVSLWP